MFHFQNYIFWKEIIFFYHWLEIFDLLSVYKISFIMMDIDFLTEICIFRLCQPPLDSLNNVLFVSQKSELCFIFKIMIFKKKWFYYHWLWIFDVLSVSKISFIMIDVEFLTEIYILIGYVSARWAASTVFLF